MAAVRAAGEARVAAARESFVHELKSARLGMRRFLEMNADMVDAVTQVEQSLAVPTCICVHHPCRVNQNGR